MPSLQLPNLLNVQFPHLELGGWQEDPLHSGSVQSESEPLKVLKDTNHSKNVSSHHHSCLIPGMLHAKSKRKLSQIDGAHSSAKTI